jgi:preprotein translocase subunit YajC
LVRIECLETPLEFVFPALLFLQVASPDLMQLLLPVGMLGIMYVLLFMPMQKQKKAQQKMLSELKNGDEVVTNGGLVGIVVSVNADDSLTIRVRPDNVKLQIVRGAVQSVVQEEKK